MSSIFTTIDANTYNSTQPSENILKGKIQTVFLAVSEAKEHGLTTREIAEICDMSVYAARNWLLKLEESGHIYKSSRPRKTTWYIN